jgi:hypothetical protein
VASAVLADCGAGVRSSRGGVGASTVGRAPPPGSRRAGAGGVAGDPRRDQRPRSGWWWERAQAGERGKEVFCPGPAGGHPQHRAARGADEPCGQCEQSPAQGARGPRDRAGEPDRLGPAQQVVREAGDHGPGGIGAELARGESRARAASWRLCRDLAASARRRSRRTRSSPTGGGIRRPVPYRPRRIGYRLCGTLRA